MADKLAEKIQNSELGTFIEEDDLIKISTEALKLAFFKPVKVQREGQYGRSELVDGPPVVATLMIDMFTEVMKAKMAPIITALVEMPEFNHLVRAAVTAAIPRVAHDQAYNLVSRASQEADRAVTDKINLFMGQQLGIQLPPSAIMPPRDA